MTGDYHDINQEESVFEMILWQHMDKPIYFDPLPNYNESLSNNLTELYGEYLRSRHAILRGLLGNNISSPMLAIGVSFSSAASVGNCLN